MKTETDLLRVFNRKTPAGFQMGVIVIDITAP